MTATLKAYHVGEEGEERSKPWQFVSVNMLKRLVCKLNVSTVTLYYKELEKNAHLFLPMIIIRK